MENILLATYFTAAAGAVVFFVLKARAAWRKVKVQDAIERLNDAMVSRSPQVSRRADLSSVRANGAGRS